MKKILLFLILTFEIFANERIVSLSPAITEILFGLHKGKDVVAVTKFSNYPKEAQKLPIIGSFVSIDIEKILALKPTLVIAQQFQKSFTQKLQKLGIKVLFVKLESIANIEESILSLGKRLNAKKQAKELIDSIERAKKRAKHTKKRKRVLVIFGLKENLKNGIYVSGKRLFYNEILEICGNINAFSDPDIAQPVLNYENIIALNPDTVLILYSKVSNPYIDEKKAISAWLSLPIDASKQRDIHIIKDEYIFIPSQRIASTIERICKEL